MYMAVSVLTATAALLPVSRDNLDDSEQFTHPGVHRTLVSRDILLGGPLSIRHIISKTAVHFIPFWSFTMNISILKALNRPTIKSPLILFMLFFLKFIWPHFSFYIKHSLRNSAPDNTMTNFNILMRSRKSKLVIMCWASNEKILRIIWNNILLLTWQNSIWVKTEYPSILVIQITMI